MTKIEFVAQAAKEFGIKHESVKKVLDAFVENIKVELEEKGSFSIHNFGTFRVKSYEARESRNPKTGEKIMLPTRRIIKFKDTNR